MRNNIVEYEWQLGSFGHVVYLANNSVICILS